jgi:hypothetical protein
VVVAARRALVAEEQGGRAGEDDELRKATRAGGIRLLRQPQGGAQAGRRQREVTGEVRGDADQELGEKASDGRVVGPNRTRRPGGGDSRIGVSGVGGGDACDAQHVKGALAVHRRDVRRGPGENLVCLRGHPEVQLDETSSAFDVRSLDGLRSHGAGPLEEHERPLGPPGEPGVLRRRGEPAHAIASIRRQDGGPLERQRRRRESATTARPAGRPLELVAHRRIRFHGCRGAVPGASIGLRLPVEHVRERAVSGAPSRERRSLVDGRAHQRMAKLEPRRVHVHEPSVLRGVQRRWGGSELPRRSQDGGELARSLGGDDEEEGLCLPRQGTEARTERLLDAGAHRERIEERLSAGELRRAQHQGELEQGERVAAGSLDELLASLDGERDVGAEVDQCARRLRFESADRQLGQRGRVEASDLAFAGGEEQGDPLGAETPGDEHERFGGRMVEPVGVVDEAQKGAALGRLRKQAEDGERDEEELLPSAILQSEGAAKRTGLWRREPFEVVQDGAHELVEPRERKLRLPLDPATPEHAHVGGLSARVIEERGLAHSRLAMEDEGAAPRVTRAIQQRGDSGALGLSADERDRHHS